MEAKDPDEENTEISEEATSAEDKISDETQPEIIPAEDILSWKRTSTSSDSCLTIKATATTGLQINWGDDSIETLAVPFSPAQEFCHTYPASNTSYEVQISHPELLTFLDISNQNVTVFVGGKGENVQILSLSGNALTTLNPTALDKYAKLEVLYLQENNLKNLKSNIFSMLPKLYHLNLSQNQIQDVETGALSILNKVTKLAVFNNCLDKDALPASEVAYITSKSPLWEANQNICIGEIEYDTTAPTTGKVHAKVALYGDSTKREYFYQNFASNFSHLFTENGEYTFTLSGVNTTDIFNPEKMPLTANVDWILSGTSEN